MALRTTELCFRIGDFRLRDVTLEVARGEYFVVLGPTGSGKTMLLECLCGLRRIASGRIYIDGVDATRLEPRERGIGYVPQDYALFPHLSVRRNIAFGLRASRVDPGEAERRITGVAENLGIRPLLGRPIAGLSGGEKQRTALARALVIRPKVLLLDEPVSTLDGTTREVVCTELRRLQRELGVTTLHICHDLEEALSVADRAGILRDGAFEQIGTLDELLRRPCSEFVARFTRCRNLLSGVVVGPCKEPDVTAVDAGGIRFAVPGRHEGEVTMVIRPEHVHVVRVPASAETDGAVIPVRLIRVVDQGAYVRAELDGPVRVVAHLSHAVFSQLGAGAGDELAAVIRRDAIHVLPGSPDPY